MEKIVLLLFLISLLRFIFTAITNSSYTFFTALSSSVITFFASCGYLLPIYENINYYDEALDQIPLLRWLLPKYIDYNLIDASDPRIKITVDSNLFTELGKTLSSYGSFIIFFAIYFLIIRSGKKYNIPYFVRYNVMHAILIMILQVPLTYFYVELVQFLTLNQGVKLFTENLANSIIIVNFSLIFYSMFFALTNRYVKLPIVSDAARLHVGKED